MLSSFRWKPRFERRERALIVPRDLIPSEGVEIPTLREALPRISTELGRARRYARPMALSVLSLAPVTAERPAGRREFDDEAGLLAGDLFPLLSALLAPSLREVLRQADIVTYTTKEAQALVVLPETTADGARQAIRRLLHVGAIQALAPLRTGTAAFPDDGWTLEDVILRAEEEWALGAGAHLHSRGGDA